MIYDALVLWHNAAAYNASVTAIDLGSVRPGPGERLQCFVSCENGDMAGLTAITVTDGATDTAADACAVFSLTAAALNAAGTFFFDLPHDIARYVKIALTGSSAGTGITSGLVTGKQNNL